MHYIVGLGNPGEKYAHTRHNIGWQALDVVCRRNGLPALVEEKEVSGRVTEGTIVGKPVQVLYPDTFMNNSGAAVAKFVPRNEVTNLIIIHDEIDLPFGEMKIVKGRGDGGNNGVRSVIEKLGSKDFIRIRIGIAPRSIWTGEVKRPKGGGPLERFVLKPFSKKESEQLPEIYDLVTAAVSVVLKEGAEVAMNTFN